MEEFGRVTSPESVSIHFYRESDCISSDMGYPNENLLSWKGKINGASFFQGANSFFRLEYSPFEV